MSVVRWCRPCGDDGRVVMSVGVLVCVCRHSELGAPARRVEALRLLVALLPLSNRDTLWALLTFLDTVSRHSTDSLDQHGNTVRTIQTQSLRHGIAGCHKSFSVAS